MKNDKPSSYWQPIISPITAKIISWSFTVTVHMHTHMFYMESVSIQLLQQHWKIIYPQDSS